MLTEGGFGLGGGIFVPFFDGVVFDVDDEVGFEDSSALETDFLKGDFGTGGGLVPGCFLPCGIGLTETGDVGGSGRGGEDFACFLCVD